MLQWLGPNLTIRYSANKTGIQIKFLKSYIALSISSFHPISSNKGQHRIYFLNHYMVESIRTIFSIIMIFLKCWKKTLIEKNVFRLIKIVKILQNFFTQSTLSRLEGVTVKSSMILVSLYQHHFLCRLLAKYAILW